MILYLHGFRSSPLSFKARAMAQHLRELGRESDFVCPQLPASPRLAIALAESIILKQQARQDHQAHQKITVIGSSLGGYYATYLAEKFGLRAILINPAVKPPNDLAKYIGVTTAFHSDEPFEFKASYVDELHAYAVPQISAPQRYFLLAATGDEVLDWREMLAHYAAAKHIVIQGSDHGMADFVDYFADIMAFCDA
jgi:uncharacterized protein